MNTNTNTFPYAKTAIKQWVELNITHASKEDILAATFPIAAVGTHDHLIAACGIDPGTFARDMHDNVRAHTDTKQRWCLIVTVETHLGNTDANTTVLSPGINTHNTRVNQILTLPPATTVRLLSSTPTSTLGHTSDITPRELSRRFLEHVPHLRFDPAFINNTIVLNDHDDAKPLICAVESYQMIGTKSPLYTTADFFPDYASAVAYVHEKSSTTKPHPVIVGAAVTGILPETMINAMRTYLAHA